ncbi:unnamed protein product [Paramecium pentaurelia]|uniref:Tc1-like transposase DDE domain-containing protein n=1 Tax=Paramecium pentaurelia TaxID=43138 RepID=A0A8S1WHH8_9CILI|nr:unnamed protein product [Paramecium pentaurelia]
MQQVRFIVTTLYNQLGLNAVLVLDNSPIHKSKLVQKLLTAKPYLFLPPYSPQLNPIEKIWNIFKQFIRKNQQVPTQNLHRMIHGHFNSITNEQLENYLWSLLKELKKSLDSVDY